MIWPFGDSTRPPRRWVRRLVDWLFGDSTQPPRMRLRPLVDWLWDVSAPAGFWAATLLDRVTLRRSRRGYWNAYIIHEAFERRDLRRYNAAVQRVLTLNPEDTEETLLWAVGLEDFGEAAASADLLATVWPRIFREGLKSYEDQRPEAIWLACALGNAALAHAGLDHLRTHPPDYDDGGQALIGFLEQSLPGRDPVARLDWRLCPLDGRPAHIMTLVRPIPSPFASGWQCWIEGFRRPRNISGSSVGISPEAALDITVKLVMVIAHHDGQRLETVDGMPIRDQFHARDLARDVLFGSRAITCQEDEAAFQRPWD